MYTVLEARSKHEKLHNIVNRIKKDKYIYAFVIPGLVLILIFRYLPIYYLQIAFRSFRVTRPLAEAPWVGLQYFVEIFKNPDFISAFRNTIIINILTLVFSFPAPIILAIMINEIVNTKFKRVTQTLLYLPHFVAWAVISGIIMSFLSYDTGIINKIIEMFGGNKVVFMASKQYFVAILVLAYVWKETGWGTILYLASISKIDTEIYEASKVDGANRFQRMVHITFPGMSDIIVVLLIISIGNLLTSGFEQILVMYNPRVYEVADVIDTYVYRTGLLQGRYSFAAAAGLFESVLAMVLLFGSDFISKKIAKKGLI